jgi:hypothetical protein
MKNLLISLALIIGSTVSAAGAQEAPVKSQKCTSFPCGNTESGEDPQEQRIREGAARADKVRSGSDDRRRWSSVILYSDSTKPDSLKMPVVGSAELEMSLDPKLGLLRFSKPGMSQKFNIASPAGEKKSICPGYSIQIIEASSAHALVRMTCFQYEYAPGRYNMGVDYYLYDAQTAVMRNIWRAAISDKHGRMPHARPTPSLKIIPNGYRFDWSGVQPSNGQPSTTVLHNTYIRTPDKSGEKVLLCTNLNAPKGEGLEDEMCEGGILPSLRD